MSVPPDTRQHYSQRPTLPTRRVTRPLTRAGLAALVLLFVGLVPLARPGVVAAETPNDVIDELAVDGVYIAPGRSDIDEETLRAAVEDARFDGVRVVIVAPRIPLPDAKSFARRIQEATSADVAIVFPEDEPLQAFVIDDLSGSKVRALNVARQSTEPARAVRRFVEEISSQPDGVRPPLIDNLLAVAVACTVLFGAALAIEHTRKQGRGPKATEGATGAT